MFERLAIATHPACGACAVVGLLTSFALRPNPRVADPSGSAIDSAANVTQALPSAREIVDRHVQSVGGREALLRIKSRLVRARYEIPSQRLRGQIEIFSARPNKRVIRVQYPEVGTSVTGFDGTIGWKVDPGGKPVLVRGRQLAQLREESEFDIDLHRDGQYRSMETVEVTTFEGRPCYSVKLVTPSGRLAMEYFDTTTGRLAGSEVRRETDKGEITVLYVLSHYREVDGVRLPDKIRISAAHVEQLVTVLDVEHDRVPSSVFEVPSALRDAARQ
jgi:hypothetical protein